MNDIVAPRETCGTGSACVEFDANHFLEASDTCHPIDEDIIASTIRSSNMTLLHCPETRSGALPGVTIGYCERWERSR